MEEKREHYRRKEHHSTVCCRFAFEVGQSEVLEMYWGFFTPGCLSANDYFIYVGCVLFTFPASVSPIRLLSVSALKKTALTSCKNALRERRGSTKGKIGGLCKNYKEERVCSWCKGQKYDFLGVSVVLKTWFEGGERYSGFCSLTPVSLCSGETMFTVQITALTASIWGSNGKKGKEEHLEREDQAKNNWR